MIVRIEWLVEGRVIICKISGEITLQDTRSMFEQIAQMVRDGGKPPYVHFICDVRQRGSIAPDILSLGQLRQLIGDNSLVGWTIVVDSQPHLIMKSLAHILSQLLKARLRVFTTMQEAVSFLVDMDKTLPVLEVEQIERRLT